VTATFLTVMVTVTVSPGEIFSACWPTVTLFRPVITAILFTVMITATVSPG
jgi:hypothetical protein